MSNQKPLTLSAAIREGAKLRPQGFGGFMDPDGRSCALGAAYEGWSGNQPVTPSFGRIDRELSGAFPILNRKFDHPEWEWHASLRLLIGALNDTDGWTRERIADWVATLEEAPDAR